ncbi:HAD-superfamily hydrolase, subfamily IA, variant 3 [Rhodopirellula maiorica SM1]|uniref:HAD-superfamily hydrolase, subfamily IA, variant 3 n=2 Tax=Novipirellula TaxID=2795426 RepID=M5RJV8_9BACT|nr:HAD-superfamily hydrolase, subfamily IA, variant 3 [Rhodopirellula maiorica SM1]
MCFSFSPNDRGAINDIHMNIEFVYFDLGNVIVSFDPNIAVGNVASRFGVDVALAEQAIYRSGLQDRFEHGHVTGEEYAAIVRDTLAVSDVQMPTAALLDAISDMFKPIESMRNTVTQVHESGTRYGLLSNTCHAHWDWIARQTWQVSSLKWPVRVLSCEVSSMKPDGGIYQVAEKLAGVAPEAILFLDDKPENVAAAIDRGWKAVQCFGGEQAVDALKKYGVIA